MPSHLLKHKAHTHSRMELLATQLVEGSITGLHKSPFHGFSVEFAEHRPYNMGESIRHIDWKLYGRSDKLFTKRYEEETNLRCQLLVDVSPSMHYPQQRDILHLEHPNKLGFSLLSAATIVQMLKKQRDAVGLSTFGQAIQLHTDCKSNGTHIEHLFHSLEHISQAQQPSTPQKTHIDKALHYLAERLHKRSLLIIFSDLLNVSDFDAFIHALRHIKHQKHELILFHVIDKASEIQLKLPQQGPTTFIDVESREKIRLRPQEIQAQYRTQMEAFQKSLRLSCAKYKIDFVSADIGQGFDPIFSTFLNKRKRLY